MKAKYLLLVFTILICQLLTHQVFASQCNKDMCASEECECYIGGSFTHLSIGGGWTAGHDGKVAPSIGLGRRFVDGPSAIDVSLNWSGNDRYYSYATPRLMYLRYFDPCFAQSLYVGAGASFGGYKIKTKNQRYTGVSVEGVVGYEMCRNQSFRTFIELGISQEIISTVSHHKHTLNPRLSLIAGVGF